MSRVLIAGDFCPVSRVENFLEEKNYALLFKDVRDIIQSVDYAVVNLECPIVIQPASPIVKCGPNLSCGSSILEAIRYIGFNMLTLANNHILDYGENGLQNTITECKKYGLDWVGVGTNINDAQKIFYKNINGYNFAFINICEHEYSIASQFQGGANPLDPLQNFYHIKEAKQESDYVIVIVHGGHEHYQLPSVRIKKTYRFFVDAGADVFVNHHQHCYSGYEIYQGKPIFYGIGNFCFDNPQKCNDIWNEGYMVLLNFDRTNISFELHPYQQCNEIVGVHLLSQERRNFFDNNILELNSIIQNDRLLYDTYMAYVQSRDKSIMSVFEPYNSRILRAIYNRFWLPSFLGNNRLKIISNLIFCESHLDVLRSLLYKKLNIPEY